jgi:ethanolamine permease
MAGWQAAGLCLAAMCLATTRGLGALFGAAVFAPVIYALVQLRAHAPDATSTATLVASTFGPRVGAFTKALQVIGYALLAIFAAQGLGSGVVFATAERGEHSGIWLWPLAAAAAVVVAALVVSVLPDRVLAAVAVLLALTGVLIHFYFGLAVAARFLSGMEPVMGLSTLGPPSEKSDLEVFAELAGLGVTLVAFEVVTTRMPRVRSLGRPMGLAVAVVVLVAAVVWYATDLGGAVSMSGEDFPRVVHELYGPAGSTWLLVAGLSMFAAGLLALTWGAKSVLDRGRAFALFVALSAVIALVLSLLSTTFGPVGQLVLVALYVVVLIASCRIPGGDFITWWLRALTPIALLAVVLIPPVVSLQLVAFEPVAIAIGLVAAAAISGPVGTRSRPG